MQALLDLEAVLDRDTVARMAQIFVDAWSAERATLIAPELAPEGERRAAQRKAAHDLVTNAGSLGFSELSGVARQLEQAILKADALEVARSAPQLSALGASAVAALSSRYGCSTPK